VHNHAASQSRTCVDDHTGVEVAIIANHHAFADAATGADVRAVANYGVGLDHGVSIDRSRGSDSG